MRPVAETEIGKIIRGKYIFLTRLALVTIEVVEIWIEEEQ